MSSASSFRRVLLSLSISLALFPVEKACGQAAGSVEVMDAKRALEGLPKELLHDLKPNSKNVRDAITELRQFLKDKIDKKTASISFKIKAVEKFGNNITVESSNEEERVAGTAFMVRYRIMLNQSQNGLAAKFRSGSKVKATGELNASVTRFTSSSGAVMPGFTIELHNPVFD